MSKSRFRPTYAGVMSSIAVFIALGGGAYAAAGGFVASGGAIKGCVSKQEQGELKVIRAGKCPAESTPLTFNARGQRGLRGKKGATGAKGPAGAPGPAGAAGKEGPQGPAGVSGQTRWGNVLIAPEGADVTVAAVGPFVLKGHCDSSGNGEYILTTTSGPAWVYAEDGPYGEEVGAGEEAKVATDEDYDESFYAWSPSTGVAIQGLPFHWNKEHGSSGCEFQGTVTQTS